VSDEVKMLEFEGRCNNSATDRASLPTRIALRGCKGDAELRTGVQMSEAIDSL